MRVIIILSLILLTNVVCGQTGFYRQYANSGFDFGQGVTQLSDSSFLITGASSSFTGSQTQAFILKVDSIGDYLWSIPYGGSESDWGRRIMAVEGFGIFVAGYTNSFGSGDYDCYLFKTDDNGNLEWEKTYGGFGWDKVNDAVLAGDSGVVMVGETNSFPLNDRNAFIVRTDKFGDTLWTKVLGGAGEDWASAIEFYDDTTFIVSVNHYIEDSSRMQPAYYRYHVDGNMISADTLYATGNVEINHFYLQTDTLNAIGRHYVGPTDSLDLIRYVYNFSTQSYLHFVNTDLPGNSEGVFYVRNPQAYNAKYMVYNYENFDSYPDGNDIHVGLVNSGNSWFGTATKVEHEGPDVAGEIIECNDNTVILVGYATTGGFGGATVFLSKFGPGAYPDWTGTTYDELVSLEEVYTDLDVGMYPNPTESSFKIIVDLEDDLEYRIINQIGEPIKIGTFNKECQIDVADISSGLYLVELFQNGVKQGVYRLIKK